MPLADQSINQMRSNKTRTTSDKNFHFFIFNFFQKLYATLSKFSPSSPDKYPVEPGTTVLSVIEKLGIPANQAKLVFINGVKCELTMPLHGGERVGIFPPVGGG
jgi:sulfur-carrier protein